MARSTSASHPTWTQYGGVMKTRCPDCPRIEPLKRLVCKSDEDGNCGREFVKCESNPQPGKILKKCWHFEWMDEYIERLQLEGSIDLKRDATWEQNLPFAVENLGSDRVVPTVENAEAHVELKGKLKKINKQLRQMLDLKKRENMMAGGFYCCIIAMGFFYLLFIYR